MNKVDAPTYWIEPRSQKSEAHMRLFCFPNVGGGSSIFRGWRTELPDVEICAVLLPGREGRIKERALDRLTPLVQTLAEVLPFDKPFAFFGHSMGALVGFELARELRRQHCKMPTHLLVSAHAAPHIRQNSKPLRHLMSDDRLIEELRHLGGTPEEVLMDRSLMEVFLPVLRADFAVVETCIYSPEEPLSCPITAFGGEQDPDTTYDHLLAWREHTQCNFSLRMFPGGHFYLHEIRREFLKNIRETLQTALPRNP